MRKMKSFECLELILLTTVTVDWNDCRIEWFAFICLFMKTFFMPFSIKIIKLFRGENEEWTQCHDGWGACLFYCIRKKRRKKSQFWAYHLQSDPIKHSSSSFNILSIIHCVRWSCFIWSNEYWNKNAAYWQRSKEINQREVITLFFLSICDLLKEWLAMFLWWKHSVLRWS